MFEKSQFWQEKARVEKERKIVRQVKLDLWGCILTLFVSL